MNDALLIVAGGLGCLLSGAAAVLLTGRRQAGVMLGGALAFLALVLALLCAGVLGERFQGRTPGESTADEILEQMIEREVR